MPREPGAPPAPDAALSTDAVPMTLACMVAAKPGPQEAATPGRPARWNTVSPGSSRAANSGEHTSASTKPNAAHSCTDAMFSRFKAGS